MSVNREFFTLDPDGPTPKPRVLMHMLKHPMFALKAGQMKDFSYRLMTKRGEIEIKVSPSSIGRATLSDRDFIVYALSIASVRKFHGLTESPEISFPLTEFLSATRRCKCSSAYTEAEAAVQRLSGTTYLTNLETGGIRETEGFHLCSASITKQGLRNKGGRRASTIVTIRLGSWVWRSFVTRGEMLGFSPDAFDLPPIKRRIHDMARAYCGQQCQIRLPCEWLAKVAGNVKLKHFRAQIMLLKGEVLPYGYEVKISRAGVIFSNENQIIAAQARMIAPEAKGKDLQEVKRLLKLKRYTPIDAAPGVECQDALFNSDDDEELYPASQASSVQVLQSAFTHPPHDPFGF